jgi:hypothetical protein
MKTQIIIIGFALLFPVISSGQANYVEDRADVLRSFSKYLALNRESISIAHSGNLALISNADIELRAYAGDSLTLALTKCRLMLLEKPDTILMRALSDLIIHNENSTNGEAVLRYGEVFIHNPEFVESILNDYDRQKRAFLIRALEGGFKSVVIAAYETFQKSRIDSLERRIHLLKQTTE